MQGISCSAAFSKNISQVIVCYGIIRIYPHSCGKMTDGLIYLSLFIKNIR